MKLEGRYLEYDVPPLDRLTCLMRRPVSAVRPLGVQCPLSGPPTRDWTREQYLAWYIPSVLYVPYYKYWREMRKPVVCSAKYSIKNVIDD